MRTPSTRPSVSTPLGAALVLLLIGLALLPPAHANPDPLLEAESLKELGVALLEAGHALNDAKRVRSALLKLKDSRDLFAAAQGKAWVTPGVEKRIERTLKELDGKIAFADKLLTILSDDEAEIPPPGEPGDEVPPPGAKTPDVTVPEPAPGESLWKWCRRVQRMYRETEDPKARGQIALRMAVRAEVLSAKALLELFAEEEAAAAREGLHEALAMVGTNRVANAMGQYAVERHRKRWDDALDVIYRCLEKKEKEEPEKPFLRAVRRFHERKDRKLTLRILDRLDAMGYEGIAALGEVIYVEDFGYHDHTIRLLATKRDRRAVPPLVHKMNRFKFEYRVQMPAHRALLQLGWYAVPELIDRLDDKAAGIWISWTLRKITGETMGTDKRKWHDWWKTEKVRHPELFEDPDERPATPTGVDGPPLR